MINEVTLSQNSGIFRRKLLGIKSFEIIVTLSDHLREAQNYYNNSTSPGDGIVIAPYYPRAAP